MLLEKPMRGSFENDWPEGDYCGICIECGSEYHGRRYQVACYECVYGSERMTQREARWRTVLGVIIQFGVMAILYYYFWIWGPTH